MKFLVIAVALFGYVGARSINAGWVLPQGNLGVSGIVRKDGTIEQFTGDFAHDIVAIGPAGIVTKSGQNLQLDADLHRVKRTTGFVRPNVGSIGLSGMVLTDGTIIPFSGDFTHDIVAIGESGIVTKSGKNIQLTRDLHRVKRHIMNESGILTADGQAFVFKEPAYLVLEGPSALIFSDGTMIQKKHVV